MSVLVLRLAMFWVLAGPAFGDDSRMRSYAEPESQPLAVAEEKLVGGESAAAVALYQEAFSDAAAFEERLSLIGPLGRAHFVKQDLAAVLANPEAWEKEADEAWEPAVYRAALFQFLGDLSAAREKLAAVDEASLPSDLAGAFRRQQMRWAEEAGDEEGALPFQRLLFEELGDTEAHQAYVRGLIEGRAEGELVGHLEKRRGEFGVAKEAEFWRSFLPELTETGLLGRVAPYLEKAWEENRNDPVVLFALAELRLFQGRLDDSAELFWEVFAMFEEVEQVDGIRYFQRLNGYLHHRFPVKYRVDQGTGRYGSELCRKFSLFGFGSDVNLVGIEAARDLALLYLREMISGKISSALFLERVTESLDHQGQPPGARILAMAGLGAPKAMVEEVIRFVDSSVTDTAAAEFSLFAMNRYVMSTLKFPQIRVPMIDLAERMDGKFEEGRTAEELDGHREMANRVLRRLGKSDGDVLQERREEGFEGMGLAAERGNAAEAEGNCWEMQAEAGGEGLDAVLLFLARLWGVQGERGKAAMLVAQNYRRFQLEVAAVEEEPPGTAARARFVLLGELPLGLLRSSNALRRTALSVLEETGELEDYRASLEGLLAVAPESFSLPLLLGELAEFEGRRTDNREEARGHYREAVALRPGATDLRLDYADWLAKHEFDESAVVEYLKVIEIDPVAVLIDFSNVLAVFERAGKLSQLLEILEEWKVPEARSIDEFYGLQPTQHLLRPLGAALLRRGDRRGAIRAWEHGLQINPITFTEQMRLELAKLYRDDGHWEEIVGLLKEYVTESDPDPEGYAIHPFASVAPRWIDMINASRQLSETPVERLVALASEEADGGARLQGSAEKWSEEKPGGMSATVFRVYLAARAGESDWRSEWQKLEEKSIVEEGPLQAAWPLVEAAFERLEGGSSVP